MPPKEADATTSQVTQESDPQNGIEALCVWLLLVERLETHVVKSELPRSTGLHILSDSCMWTQEMSSDAYRKECSPCWRQNGKRCVSCNAKGGNSLYKLSQCVCRFSHVTVSHCLAAAQQVSGYSTYSDRKSVV